jgi:excisionase family DNA binding protein
MMETGDEMMRPGEVAALFGVTTKTVARWGSVGLLRAVRTPGGHMRYYAANVRALAGARADAPTLGAPPRAG